MAKSHWQQLYNYILRHHRIAAEKGSALMLQEPLLLRLKYAIEANLEDENFGIKALCYTVGLSRTQLHRKIKACTGLSTSIFIRAIRLQKAKELLISTNLNISEIAYAVGFSDPKYFSRTFAEMFGLPPVIFRRQRLS